MMQAQKGGRLRLRLVVRVPDAPPQDVEVDAAPAAATTAVADAVAAQLGLDERLLVGRTGRLFAGEQPIARAGLVQGDEIVSADGADHPAESDVQAVVAVSGGPRTGARIPLASGDHLVGRGDAAAIRIDDAALSASHLLLRVNDDGGVEVIDHGSRNGTAVAGRALEPHEPHRLEPGDSVQAGRTVLELAPPPQPAAAVSPEVDGFVPFNRPPRVQRPLEPQLRPFPAPPGDPHRSRLPLAASLLPLLLGVALYLITGFPTMLLFAALSPVLAVGTYLEDRRSGKRGFGEGALAYRRKLAALSDELEVERGHELRRRSIASPSAPELVRRALRREAALWERRADDSDFLAVRLGTADQPPHLSVRIDPGGSDALRREADELVSWYARISAAPVVAPLAELGVLGLCGPRERVDALGRWLAVQAATLHSPRDLVIAAAVGAERVDDWDWLKWLPHTRAEGGGLPARLAVGREGARELVDAVAELVAERLRDAESQYSSSRARPAVLLVLDESVAPERPRIAAALGRATEAGVAALWLGRERRELPGECRGIVELDSGVYRLAYTDARDGVELPDVTAEVLDTALARRVAVALAPVRDTSSAGAAAAIPEHATMLELLSVEAPDAEWVQSRWRDPTTGRIALLGAAAGRPFTVDLQADGPHALVAGITGAGKSELLQTLIASLATSYPPTRLTFLLVDYKGGAAFKDCVRLPHAVGLVTDLDGHLAQRALASLNAELRRRERILGEAGAKDLADMELRDPESAPPSLVIVIDEFATLAREVPDFVNGVVDVAQRGRSLGVHLVLATQRPSGVVSENIRANTNLRIALRVNEGAESTDVIGSQDAARISRDRPGRAFARLGHGELTEFQTAYVGGATAASEPDESIVVRELPFASALEREFARSAGTGGPTDLEQLVDAAAAAAAELRLPEPPRPWLPPLEPQLPLEQLPEPKRDGTGARVAVGLLDEPTEQRQQPLEVNLEEEGSVLVYGASGSGKTTFLRTLALSHAARSSPDELHVYGLDFATRGLVALEELPHCGSVIAGEDEERVARLFTMLRRTLEQRKHLFAQQGVFTLSEYLRSSATEPVARILVLLDGYAGFAAAFERVNLGELVDALPRLVGDGRPLGVHFAITADRRGAVPNTLAALVPSKLVLRMADDDEAAAFGIPVKVLRGAHLPPGRGFLPSGVELQLALPGGDPSGEGQTDALAAAARRFRERWPDASVPAVEPLPRTVELGDLPAPSAPHVAVLGIGDVELEPYEVDLRERHFLVAGPYRSGRSTALAAIVTSLRRGNADVSYHLLAPRRSPLTELEGWASSASGVEECDALAARLEELTEGAVVVIDDAEELAETMGAPMLEALIRRGRDAGVCFVAACERQVAHRAFAGWLRELRKDEHGLLLDPDLDVDGDLLGARLPRRTNPVFPPGRGYAVDRGSVELVQVARS